MAWTSWQTPGTIAELDRAGGTVSWTNISNVGAEDGSEASALLNLTTSEDIKCTNFDWSEIPSGATITGAKARIKRRQNNLIDGGISTTYYKLVKGGSAAGSEKTQSASWGVSLAFSSDAGGTGDLWSTTFTYAEAVASDTGILIAMRDDAGAGTIGYIDVVEMAFEYSVASTRRRVYSSMM